MSAGKGDTYRKVKGELYRSNYDAIFRKKTGEKRRKSPQENDDYCEYGNKTAYVIINGNLTPISNVNFLNIEEDFCGRDLVTFEYNGKEMQSLVIMK